MTVAWTVLVPSRIEPQRKPYRSSGYRGPQGRATPSNARSPCRWGVYGWGVWAAAQRTEHPATSERAPIRDTKTHDPRSRIVTG